MTPTLSYQAVRSIRSLSSPALLDPRSDPVDRQGVYISSANRLGVRHQRFERSREIRGTDIADNGGADDSSVSESSSSSSHPAASSAPLGDLYGIWTVKGLAPNLPYLFSICYYFPWGEVGPCSDSIISTTPAA